VLGRIADDHADETPGVDAALRAWGRQHVEVDEDALVEKVRRRVEAPRTRTDRGAWVRRLIRPIAAAAAVGIVVTAWFGYERSVRPVVEVSMSRPVAIAHVGSHERVHASRVVVFERTVVADSGRSHTDGRGAFAVVGVGRVEEEVAETPPL
jgi:hypothetical protein